MNPKYIFVDIDGTLLHYGRIPQSSIAALRQAKANGHKIFICTGRSVGMIPKEISSVIEYDGMICSSGSYLSHNNQICIDACFPAETQALMVDVFCQYPIIFAMETNHTVFYNHYDDDIFNIFPYPKVDYDPKLIEDSSFIKTMLFDRNNSYPKTNKICIFSKEGTEHLETISEQLPRDIIQVSKEMVLWEVDYREITPVGYSKLLALQYLIDNYRLPYDDIIAIGDSVNDYEVIKFAKIGIAMGNGNPKLKAIADYVTGDIDADGFYQAFVHFRLI